MYTLSLFFALALPQGAPPGDSLRALQVLTEAREKIRATRTLTYHSVYRQVYSGVDDSVTLVSGTVWLERLPRDTIFGYRFHVKGADRSPFDYFYDGKLAREYRRSDKELSEFDPYEENSVHSPAKSRMALLPVLAFETDTDLVSTVTEHCVSLSVADSGRYWVVTNVQANSPSYAQTNWIWIDKDSKRVTRSEIATLYNGTHFQVSVRISDIVADTEIRDSLVQPVGLAYKITRWVKPTPPKPSPLEGKMAAEFNYTTFDGKTVRLSDLKGQYVLLDFWESWCGWCIDAFPHLAALDSGYRGRNFRLLAIVSENLDKVQTILDANRLPYSTLKGDAQVIKDYQVNGRPTYVLIDPLGKIIAYAPGGLDRMKALLQQRLGEPAVTTPSPNPSAGGAR